MKKEGLRLGFVFFIFLNLVFCILSVSGLDLPAPPASPTINSGGSASNSILPSENLVNSTILNSSDSSFKSVVSWPVLWISLGVILLIVIFFLVYFWIKK